MLFWFTPPIAPTILELKIKTITKAFSLKIENKTKGAIFCQINIITHMFQSINIMIWGNQKCRGAIPDFSPRIIKIIKFKFKLIKLEDLVKSSITTEIKIIEAIACGIKYLIADSVELKFSLKRIRGITLIKLISNPSQVINQDLEEHAKIVPAIRNAVKII